MISILDINKAINSTIDQALSQDDNFKDVEIVAEDVTEPIIRPSIKIQFEDSTNGRFNVNMREKKITCRIYFFCKDRYHYKIDNMKMQELIENVFIMGLYVPDNFYIPIDSVDSIVSDTVLQCSFDINTLEDIPEETINKDTGEDYEDMEELNLNIREDD